MEWRWPNGSIFSRRREYGAFGDVTPSHGHEFWHLHDLQQGAVLAKTREKENGDVISSQVLDAAEGQNYFPVPAGVWHEFEALPRYRLDEGNLRVALMRAGVAREAVDLIVAAAQVPVLPVGDCLYSHRTPQALVERMGLYSEYDAELQKVIDKANVLFGDVVQVWRGNDDATR